jgi:hypothetical protein
MEDLVKEFSIELAIRLQDPFNNVDFTDTQKLAKRIYKIISTIRFGVIRDETPLMLNSDKNVKESDTTGSASSNTADTIEEKREPITTALYNSGIHNTDHCDQLADNILTVLNDYGYEIVKSDNQINQSSNRYTDEEIEKMAEREFPFPVGWGESDSNLCNVFDVYRAKRRSFISGFKAAIQSLNK